MKIFEIVADVIVIAGLIYVSFVLTLADWLAALHKGRAVSLLPERNGRTWPFWTQIGMVILGGVLCAFLFFLLWIPLVKLSEVARFVLGILGLAVYLAGGAFVLWARRSLGRMWGISTSRNVKLLDDHQLIQTGPYAFVRHPMYFGWWAAMVGLLLLYPTWVVLLFLVFSVVAFIGRARREEAVLSEHFGEAWKAYMTHSKFIIPFVY